MDFWDNWIKNPIIWISETVGLKIRLYEFTRSGYDIIPVKFQTDTVEMVGFPTGLMMFLVFPGAGKTPECKSFRMPESSTWVNIIREMLEKEKRK